MKIKSFAKKQAGFTLIELVVVIVILGILAATALPRFIGLQTNAAQAALAGMQGAVQSASALAHAQYLVSGTTSGLGTVTMDGTPVAVNNGYPTAAGIQTALSASDGFAFLAVGQVGTFTLTKAASTACTVTYTATTTSGAAPSILSDNSGC